MMILIFAGSWLLVGAFSLAAGAGRQFVEATVLALLWGGLVAGLFCLGGCSHPMHGLDLQHEYEHVRHLLLFPTLDRP